MSDEEMKMRKATVSPIEEAEKAPLMGMALQNAQNFLNAGKVLRAHNNACVETKQVPVFIVDVVTLAFGIELLLKALLYYTGQKAHGHKMNELFEFLPTKTQAGIKDAYADHLVRTTGHNRDLFGLTFEDRLVQYADTFHKWRYQHEANPGTFDSRFCDSFAQVLNELAHAQFNELREAYLNSQIA